MTCSSNEEATSSQPDEAMPLNAWEFDSQTLFAQGLGHAWWFHKVSKGLGGFIGLYGGLGSKN